jgi:hypothetical protein
MTHRIRTRTRKNNKICRKQMGGEGVNGNNIPPTIKDNLKKFADIFVQLFNNMSIYTLDKVSDRITNMSKMFGIDTNKSFGDEIAKIGEKVEQLNIVLDSPEGKKALSNLSAFFDKITKTVLLPNSEKLAEGLIESLEPVLERGQHAIFALLSASPFGAVIDIPRFLSESLGVVEKSVSLVDDVLDVGHDTVSKLKEERNNLDGIVSEFGSLIDKANTQLSSGLDSVKNRVDDYGKNIMAKGMSNYDNSVLSRNAEDINSSLKQYRNEARMVGGRVKKSYSEFITSNVTSPQIIQQYGGTRKRRILKRNRLQSRRHA